MNLFYTETLVFYKNQPKLGINVGWIPLKRILLNFTVRKQLLEIASIPNKLRRSGMRHAEATHVKINGQKSLYLILFYENRKQQKLLINEPFSVKYSILIGKNNKKYFLIQLLLYKNTAIILFRFYKILIRVSNWICPNRMSVFNGIMISCWES